jgi:DNA helicase IV
MALRMLARRSLNGSFTIVGDIAQATSPGAADDWDDVLRHLPLGTKQPRVRELTLSYRIPAPNLRVALRVLAHAAPGVTPPTAVRSKGEDPRFVATEPHRLAGKVVQVISEEIAALDGGSVAVIAPDSLIDSIDEALMAAGVEFGRARSESRNATGQLHPQVALVPVTLVKGLELDGSVVVEPQRIIDEEPQGYRALYVALTRSTKRLAVVYSEGLPDEMDE